MKTFALTGSGPSVEKRLRRYSLKMSVKRKLMLRLAAAGVVIAVVLAFMVYFNEREKVGQMISARAGETAVRFNDQIRSLLDLPGLPNQEALQEKLKILFVAGNLKEWLGRLVYLGVFDPLGKEIARVTDEKYVHINAVEEWMRSTEHPLPTDERSRFQTRQFEGLPHVGISIPLSNTDGQVVAHVEGLVAVADSVVAEIEGRIYRTVLEVIIVVLATTALLYPIIQSLIGRLSGLTTNLLESNLDTLELLGSAVAKRDSDTDIHNYRVTIYAVSLAEAIGLDRESIRSLIKGAFLHDVGKIGISDRILLKPAKLTTEEFEIMKAHVEHGMDIVKRSEWLKDAADVVWFHHEKFAGDGYPTGLKGTNIPINARIFAIADVFDALTSPRPYKAPYSFEAAIAILMEKRGSHLDPDLVDTFVEIARPLFDTASNGAEIQPKAKLREILNRYFSKGVEISA
jgi:HD-GYP domain-containing protein (c-di-GMP phosphodiesterase class II)